MRKEMNSYRKTAIIEGVLYIVGTVAGMIGEVFGPNQMLQIIWPIFQRIKTRC